MDDIYLPAPEGIADLYSLFAWAMTKSNNCYFSANMLCEARFYHLNTTLVLYPVEFGTYDPYIRICYYSGRTEIWNKDMHKHEQKPSKKNNC